MGLIEPETSLDEGEATIAAASLSSPSLPDLVEAGLPELELPELELDVLCGEPSSALIEEQIGETAELRDGAPGARGPALVDNVHDRVRSATAPRSPLATALPAAATGPSPQQPGRSGREGPLSVAEERRLARRWHTTGDEKALGRLIQAHLGLVIRIAMEFRHSGPAMEDLIQEGNLGLTIAARRFDPNRATRLATYATYWIRACMLEHVVRSHGPVRIGTTRSQRKIFFGLGRARRKLEREGETANCESLAHELGVLQQDVEAMTPRLTGRDVSLDAPRGFDDRRSVGATLAEEGPTPEDTVAFLEEDESRRVQLESGLKVLDPRERAIIKARHMRQRPATLAALGKKFGISRERVRQLELRAKAKLRDYCGVPADAGPLT